MARLLERNNLEETLLAYPHDQVAPSDFAEVLLAYRHSADAYVIRQAQYATQLVLLYGAFERCMEDFVAGAIEALTENVPSYGKLPQRVQDNHRRRSLDALRDEIWLSRQSDPLLVSRLIENLSSCEAQQATFRLNSAAYSRHGGNYRRQTIDEVFRETGIDDLCVRTAAHSTFHAYLTKQTREKGLLDAELGAIDDVAERRNEIAHGAPSQLLTTKELAQYVEFFGAFARSAYAVLTQQLGRHLVAHHSMRLGEIDEVHYKKVVCLDLGSLPEGTFIQVGDPIAMYIDNVAGYELGSIVEIRSSSGPMPDLRAQAGLLACLDTDMRLKVGREIYLVDRGCPGAWLAAKPL